MALGKRNRPAGSGDEIALDLGETERRSRGRHHEVGCEDDLTSAGGRQAVDRCDDRLLAFAIDEAGEVPRARCSDGPRRRC